MKLFKLLQFDCAEKLIKPKLHLLISMTNEVASLDFNRAYRIK